MNLILASTSRYRQALLSRLNLPFEVIRPEVDETPLLGETPIELVQRLAPMKAGAVAARKPDAWVLGSDQIAELDGDPLGKPGHRERAIAQLSAMSGRTVAFHTAIAVAHWDGPILTSLDTTLVRFRPLLPDEIERYVDAEQPFDCAGSFKSEGLGITLFTAIESRDPTGLIGLPLIETARLLRDVGFQLP